MHYIDWVGNNLHSAYIAWAYFTIANEPLIVPELNLMVVKVAVKIKLLLSLLFEMSTGLSAYI